MHVLLHKHASTLRELYLTGAKHVSSKWFQELPPRSLTRLKVCELADMGPNALTPLAIERLVQACPRLTQLNLSRNNVRIDSAAEMSRWLGPRLKSLSLADSNGFSDAFVMQLTLSPWTRLGILNCSGSSLTFYGLRKLLVCIPTLHTLNASRTLIGYPPAHPFATRQAIMDEVNRQTRATPGQPFALSSLRVDGALGDVVGVLELLLPELPVLGIFSAQDIRSVESVFHLLPPSLLSLNVAKTRTDLLLVDAAIQCPRITYLNLAGCTRLKDESLRPALKMLPNLSALHLNGCSLISDEGLSTLMTEKLELLHTAETRVSRRQLGQLSKAIPFLNVQ